MLLGPAPSPVASLRATAPAWSPVLASTTLGPVERPEPTSARILAANGSAVPCTTKGELHADLIINNGAPLQGVLHQPTTPAASLISIHQAVVDDEAAAGPGWSSEVSFARNNVELVRRKTVGRFSDVTSLYEAMRRLPPRDSAVSSSAQEERPRYRPPHARSGGSLGERPNPPSPRGSAAPMPRTPSPRGGPKPSPSSRGSAAPHGCSDVEPDLRVTPTAALISSVFQDAGTPDVLAFAAKTAQSPLPNIYRKRSDCCSSDPVADLVRRLGVPSSTALRLVGSSNVIAGLRFNTSDIARLDTKFHEQRTAANLTRPPAQQGSSRGDLSLADSLGFLEELIADSKKNPFGTGYEFTIVCRATNRKFAVHHNDFTSLPDALDRWIVNTLDTERTIALNYGRTPPTIRRFRLDNHASQAASIPGGALAPLERVLTRHGIALPRPRSCRPQVLARVDRAHRQLDAMARRLLHGQAPGLSKAALWRYAYEHACRISAFLPQSGVDGDLSAFELCYGIKPTVNDIPSPAWGATAYTRDNSKPGVKQGVHRIGMFVGQVDRDLAVFYYPKSNSFAVRDTSGVRFNSAFDDWDVLARSRDLIRGEAVHVPGARSASRSAASAATETKDPVKDTRDPARVIGHIHFRGDKPIHQPYHCGNATCGFRCATERGLRMHYSRIHRTADNSAAAAALFANANALPDGERPPPPYDITYTPDPAPNLEPAGNVVTFRSLLGIADDDDPLSLDALQERPLDPVPRQPGQASTRFTFAARASDAIPTLSELRPEHAEALTPRGARAAEAALAGPFRAQWQAAMDAELATLNAAGRSGAFKQIKLKSTDRPITLKWVFKIKFHGDGTLDKFKARLVARGFTQRAGYDYDPDCISAPVARASTFRALFAIATHNKYYIDTDDVKGAYLLADLKERIVARLPPGIEAKRGADGALILVPIYGLRQSGYEFHRHYSGVLRSIGFHQSDVDPCLYIYRRHGDIIYIATWVDDSLVVHSCKELWATVRAKINAVCPLQAKTDDGCIDLIGMRLTYDREAGILKIDHDAKIDAFLKQPRIGLQDCNPSPTPISPTHTIGIEQAPVTPRSRNLVALKCGMHSYDELIEWCRIVIGFCGFLSCWGRPELCQPTYFCARYQTRPTVALFRGLKRMLRYLRTKTSPLTFGTLRFEHASPLIFMVDSDFTNHTDTKSTSGLVGYLYGCPVIWDSSKQRAVAHSTTEAELIAADRCAKTVRYMRRLITSLGVKDLPTTPVFEDNQGCIHVSRGGGSHRKLRHIRVADSYVYQCAAIDKCLSLHYVRSRDNVADLFTKATDRDTFLALRDRLMGHPSCTLTFHPLQPSSAPAGECWRISPSRGSSR